MCEFEIYFYCGKTNGEEQIYFARKNAKVDMLRKGLKPCDIKNIDTRNLIIPESQVYDRKDLPCDPHNFDP